MTLTPWATVILRATAKFGRNQARVVTAMENFDFGKDNPMGSFIEPRLRCNTFASLVWIESGVFETEDFQFDLDLWLG